MLTRASFLRRFGTYQAASKLLIRLGEINILRSGKATTRSKRRITAALRVPATTYRIPHAELPRAGTAPLKEQKRDNRAAQAWQNACLPERMNT